MFNFLFTHTPLLFFTQSFWRDEAFSYLLAKKNIIDIILLTIKDFNPPFYYIALHFWMKIFGISEIGIRSFSLLFYVLTIYVIYDFLRYVLKLGKYKTFIYLLLFIFNPVLVYYGFEARMYSMLGFFATSSFYFFITKRRGYYWLVSVLGLYTHYFMIFVLLTQISYLLMSKSSSVLRLKTVLFPYLVFFPWFLFMLFQKNDIFNPFWIATSPLKTILFLPFVLFTGYENSATIPTLYIYFSLFLICILILGISKFAKSRLFRFFLVWTFFPLMVTGLISIFKPIVLPRYLIYCTIGFNFLIVYILSNIKIMPRILFFILIILFIFNYQEKNLEYRKKSDFASKINEIKSLAKAKDLLYVTSELDYFTAQYYFGENRVFIFNKAYEKLPSYVGKILISKEKIINTLPIYPSRAFILKSDGTYDIIARY